MLSPQNEADLAPTGVGELRGVEAGAAGPQGAGWCSCSVDMLVCSGLRISSPRGSLLEEAPKERILPFAQTFPEWRPLCVSEDPRDDSGPLERKPGGARGCGTCEGFLARVPVGWTHRRLA